MSAIHINCIIFVVISHKYACMLRCIPYYTRTFVLLRHKAFKTEEYNKIVTLALLQWKFFSLKIPTHWIEPPVHTTQICPK